MADEQNQAVTADAGQKASVREAYDFIAQLMDYLPTPDKVLQGTGEDIKIYRELTYDPKMESLITARKGLTLSLEWKMENVEDKKIEDFYRSYFNDIDLYQVIEEALEALTYGYQVFEITWEKTGSFLTPVPTEKKAEWFNFDVDGNPLFRTRRNYNGEPVENDNFYVVGHRRSYHNPYGIALASRCYWSVTLKRGGWKWLANFCEKYGMPLPIMEVPENYSQTQRSEALAKLENIKRGWKGVINSGTKIQFEAIASGDSVNVHQTLIDLSNNALTEVWLLQDVLTNSDAAGTYAGRQAGKELMQEGIGNRDRRMVMGLLNKLVEEAYEINFGNWDALPSDKKPKLCLYQDEDIRQDQADLDTKIASMIGMKPSMDRLKRVYGYQDSDWEENPAPEVPTLPIGKEQPPAGQKGYMDVDAELESLANHGNIAKRLESEVDSFIGSSMDGNKGDVQAMKGFLEHLSERYPAFDVSFLLKTIEQRMIEARKLGVK